MFVEPVDDGGVQVLAERGAREGVGSVVGTLFGALIIAVINNGLDLMGVSSYYQQVIKGAIIVTAVVADVARQKRRSRS